MGILRVHLPKPSCYLNTPYKETVSFCAYTRGEEDRTERIIHIISALAEQTNGDAPEMMPVDLYLAGGLAAGKVIRQVYPERRKLKTEEERGYVRVTLPEMTIHTVLTVTQKEEESG